MIPPCQQATESSMNLINFTNSIKLNSISGIVISNKRWRLIFSRSKINARLWLILPCFAAGIRSGFGTRTPEMNRKERYYTVDHRGKETIRPRISYSTKTEYLKDEIRASTTWWKRKVKPLQRVTDPVQKPRKTKANSSIWISTSYTEVTV